MLRQTCQSYLLEALCVNTSAVKRGASSRDAMESLADALLASRVDGTSSAGSPIHLALNKQQEYSSRFLRLKYACPDVFEPLDTRLWQRDVAKGCIDPDLLGTARDEAVLDLYTIGRVFRLPAFMAHLANPLGWLDPSSDDDVLRPLWSDGTWTGTLVWDSAVHACELILSCKEWRDRLSADAGRRTPASVLELGCGLGLPGLVCHALGAAPVLLTDRKEVASLVGEGLTANNVAPSHARALEFAWSDESAAELRRTHLDGRSPDVLIACDCIFAPLFGSAFLLLRMIMALADTHTIVLLALERRHDDGAEEFFAQADAAGFAITLRARHGRVIVCEMQMAKVSDG